MNNILKKAEMALSDLCNTLSLRPTPCHLAMSSDMNIDVIEQQPNSEVSGTMIENDFDWENYISQYKGRTKIERSLFLAEQATDLRIVCSDFALEMIKTTSKDVQLYNRALFVRNTLQNGQALPAGQTVSGDQMWCEQTNKNNRIELEKLDLELRNYQNNLIRESIRMGFRDLGNHFRSVGNFEEASKYYSKTRDYCSTNEHLVEMYLNIIEVSLDLKNYAVISSYANKAEGLLDSYNPHAAAASASKNTASSNIMTKGGTSSGADAIGALFRAGGSAGATNSAMLSDNEFASGTATSATQRQAEDQGKRHLDEIRAKIYVAQALAYLGQSRYQLVVQSLLQVSIEVSDSYANLVSRSDVAHCIVLCGIAMLNRADLKRMIVDRPGIASILEHDVLSQQLLESFYACEYKKSLSLLEKSQRRSMLNLTLAGHFNDLSKRIIERILHQFVEPFDTLQIFRLANSLGWEGIQGQVRAINGLMALLQKGEINARLDLCENVLYSSKSDSREDLYSNAFETGKNQTAMSKRLLLRMSLLQNGLMVKPLADRER